MPVDTGRRIRRGGAARSSLPTLRDRGQAARHDRRADLPAEIDGVDAIYAAHHQLAEGPTHPREVRERIAAGDLRATEVIEAILTSTARALDRPQHVVIAHFGSILPKIGLSEADVPASGSSRLAAETARTGQEIEISERWRCPSAATLRPVAAPGVTIALSTDSHSARRSVDYTPPRGAERARRG